MAKNHCTRANSMPVSSYYSVQIWKMKRKGNSELFILQILQLYICEFAQKSLGEIFLEVIITIGS